ncbi:unnamed protein product [Medioppia subpectinata]|uniref:Uncharacterized protein n=1 Tax=Medioppia subpectinata TaxID=1979941 RepID=A0A7R9LXH2_9ACAR|nr:unnamed protein product [Medioppia subpectinata]CAG2121981.1 unnamed protein product [Medioppia subpectinata]
MYWYYIINTAIHSGLQSLRYRWLCCR